MAGRYRPIDILRGTVMALMAIDHVRVYAGVPAGGASVSVFFTRWITHFCAPVFIFLAGTSAYLQSQGKPDADLSRRLLVRGLWLILLEFTVLRFAWTFNFDYEHFTFLGVIWVIGICMVLLAALCRLPLPLLTAFGLIVVFGHNAIGPLLGSRAQELQEGNWAGLLQVLYFGGSFPALSGAITVQVLYTVIPWIGVMCLGFAFGKVIGWPAERRRRAQLGIGLGALGLFLVLRWFDVYGNPRPWRGASMSAPLSFINVAKYPASLLFLLMTLGPAIAWLPMLEKASSRLAGWLETFGRAPMFFYVLHIPLIHLIALGIALVRTPSGVGFLVGNHPLDPPPQPEGHMWGLWLLYLVTFVVLAILLPLCRAYVRDKETHKRFWHGLI
jgi:uncharacterized membrane protein